MMWMLQDLLGFDDLTGLKLFISTAGILWLCQGGKL